MAQRSTALAVLVSVVVLALLPVAGRAETLSLRSAVEAALDSSPQLKAARQQLLQAESNRRAAIGDIGPKADFDLSKSLWGHDEKDNDTQFGRGWPEDYEMGLSGSWELFDWGKKWLTLRERRHSADAFRQAVEAERRRIENLVVSYYFAVLEAGAVVEIETENSRLTRENAALVARLFENGARGYGDLLKVEISSRSAAISVVRAKAAREEAVAKLNVLLGRPPAAALDLEAFPDSVSAPEPLERWLGLAEAGRPDILQARSELAASEAASLRTKAEVLPSISLKTDFTEKVGDPSWTTSNPNWHFKVGLSVPIWDGLSRVESMRRATAERALREARLAGVRRTASEEIALARTSVQTNSEVYGLTRTQAEGSAKYLKFVLERYQKGAASILELTDAQSDANRLKQDLARTFYSYHAATYSLKKAAGLPWDSAGSGLRARP